MGLVVATEQAADSEPGFWFMSPVAPDAQLRTLVTAGVKQDVITGTDAETFLASIATNVQSTAIPIQNRVGETFTTAFQGVQHDLYVADGQTLQYADIREDSPFYAAASEQRTTLSMLEDTLWFTRQGLAASMRGGQLRWDQIDPNDIYRNEKIAQLYNKPEGENICAAYGIKLEWPDDPETPPTLASPLDREGTSVLFMLLGRIDEAGAFVIGYDARQEL